MQVFVDPVRWTLMEETLLHVSTRSTPTLASQQRFTLCHTCMWSRTWYLWVNAHHTLNCWSSSDWLQLITDAQMCFPLSFVLKLWFYKVLTLLNEAETWSWIVKTFQSLVASVFFCVYATNRSVHVAAEVENNHFSLFWFKDSKVKCHTQYSWLNLTRLNIDSDIRSTLPTTFHFFSVSIFLIFCKPG